MSVNGALAPIFEETERARAARIGTHHILVAFLEPLTSEVGNAALERVLADCATGCTPLVRRGDDELRLSRPFMLRDGAS